MKQTIGKAPACIECAYVEVRRTRDEGEHVRAIDGKSVVMLCTRAADPLTGNSPEYCHTERQVGLCGSRGVFFEQGDADITMVTAELEEDDFPDGIPLTGEALAEEVEEVILD